jgi:hypothetical protein
MEATTPILAGLIRKRQEIAGELETAYGRVAALTDNLRSLDDTIRLFGPETHLDEIAPKQRRYVAQPGEISRAIRETLRDAGKPLTVRDITLGVMATRGMDPHDAALFGTMQKRVMASLRNLRLGDSVRSHREAGSHLRWNLAG